MKPLVVLLLVLSGLSVQTTASAENGGLSTSEGAPAHVISVDQDLPLEELRSTPGLKVHSPADRGATKLLPPHVQERFLRDAGLEASTKEWDAFERDRFALRAENQTAKTVSERYQGRLSETAIRNFQRMVRQFRAEQRGSR